jgi:diketogulonate reductase-like aldo/keto reductase
VRAIGVSNFYPDRMMDLMMHNDVVPQVNQIEVHPFNQQVESQMFLKANQVQIESWGPFAEGRNQIFQNEVLVSIAKEHQKTVAQVILRWLIQREVVVIPKSVHPERIIENFNVFDFELGQQNMADIAALDTKESLFINHRDPEVVKRLGAVKFDI